MAVISDVSSEHVPHELNKNITLEVIKFDFCCQLDQIALFLLHTCVLYSEQSCMICIYNIYAPLSASNWLCNIAIFDLRVLVERSSYSLIFCFISWNILAELNYNTYICYLPTSPCITCCAMVLSLDGSSGHVAQV